MLDQAIAEHDEIAERNRRAIQIHHELAAERAFATDPHLLQNQLDIRDGKYTIVPSMMSNGLGHSSTYTMTDDEAGSGF
jgi:hypothetical protein